jgi:ubiquinone/menaquinone biosynthesis C-methylase UbiE
MQQALPRIEIAALDVSAPILELARDAATTHRRANPIEFVCGDACSMPFADGSFDTVTTLHVLEHLDPPSAERALQEMCRVAKHRVIVAVPLEEEPDPAYGHVQGFDRGGLINLGEKTGWRCDFEEYLGGWVVLEPR